MASSHYGRNNSSESQDIPLVPQRNQRELITSAPHGGGHTPSGSRSSSAASAPPPSPFFRQVHAQDFVGHGSPYASGPSSQNGRSKDHGGGHTPGQSRGSTMEQPPRPNTGTSYNLHMVQQTQQSQQSYAAQVQQPHISSGSIPRGMPNQGYPLPGAPGYAQQQAQGQPYPSRNGGIRGQIRGVVAGEFSLKGISGTVANPNNRTYQNGIFNIFHLRGTFKFPKFPHAYQRPGVLFADMTRRRHRDLMQRVHHGREEDQYLSPFDGHLAKLVVQAAQDVYDGAQNSTWRRTYVRNASPFQIRIANFPFSNVPADINAWTEEHWFSVCWKWLPSCIGLLLTLGMRPHEVQSRHFGFYDPFPYYHWLYPEISRNRFEDAGSDPFSAAGPPPSNNPEKERILGPRELCFLLADSDDKDEYVVRRRVEDYERAEKYILIGYTAKQFNHDSEEDMLALDKIAKRAAREAGVPAYWVASSCMSDEKEKVNDVFRISDIVRGAHSLAIAVGFSAEHPEVGTAEGMLRMWGERMWTLPEVLLSSNEHDINVYVRGADDQPAFPISKKNFAALAWGDPLISRQLVDHFNGTLILSRLELVTIALNCLSTRKRGDKFKGDMSYALMGLMRRRPEVDPEDSAFKAFARLSLANDSDMLLERLVCMQPKDPFADWHTMDDVWDAKLWDITPRCQVAGIGPGDTVILDGAFAAAIRWKSFAPMAYAVGSSWRRFFSWLMLHGAPYYLLFGIALTFFRFLAVFGFFFIIISLLLIVASPYLTRIVYGGKVWQRHAWFFGFEGYMDLATIESHIFGTCGGRLRWSPASSTISAHAENEYGERVGLDPTTSPKVRAMVEQAKNGRFGGLKVFTLVDTVTLTVTMFTAVRPPVAVIICGAEGGMQRAVMASYDSKTQTVYRETVLRMETPILSHMFRVSRFRFGFNRPMPAVRASV